MPENLIGDNTLNTAPARSKAGRKDFEMFWAIVAWLLSLILAYIIGGFAVIDALNKHPERIGLEKMERKDD